jgi:hypothetical protein
MRAWGNPSADDDVEGDLSPSVVVLPTDAAGGELGRRAAEKRRLG